jgi:fatty acid desaturase
MTTQQRAHNAGANLRAKPVEWPTLLLIVATTALWVLGTTFASALWLPLGIVVTTLAVALHSSLSHEVLHGHPFAHQRWNETLVWIQPNLLIPYGRFRDTHLAHHRDANLTDPYDDPESNYLDPAVWAKLSRPARLIFTFNNRLFGRVLIGPALGQVLFMRGDWRLIRGGDRTVLKAWLIHSVGVCVILGWVMMVSSMPLWAYAMAAYGGLSLIKIRTFLEHQAHQKCRGRTAIVEDAGPLAFLFLNNNLHVVHHLHPRVAWYKLPALYKANKDRFLFRNEGYVFRSYREVFARYFWRAKDTVPHPLWPQR